MGNLSAFSRLLATPEEGRVDLMAQTGGVDLPSPPGGGGVSATTVDFADTIARANERRERVRQFADAYHACEWKLCAIANGSKKPHGKAWQHKPLEPGAIGNHGLGLIHALSGTCAIDFDDLPGAEAWLANHGVDMRSLLAADDAVQILSGREQRAKLIYRLPPGVASLPTEQIEVGGRMILEFRCATKDGESGIQDVLPPTIHPTTGQEYKWAGAGDFASLPVLPDGLLKIWTSRTRSGESKSTNAPNDVGVIVEGTRNKTLFKLAGDMVGVGMGYNSILAGLLAENETKCAKPLSTVEVEGIVRSAMTNSYGADRRSNQVALDAVVRALADASAGNKAMRANPAELFNRLPPMLKVVAEWYQRRAFMPQEAFKLVVALASCGGVLARDFVSDNATSTNMYWVLIAPTGTGKEAALRCVDEFISTYDSTRPSGIPTSETGVLTVLARNAASCFIVDEAGEFLKGVFEQKAANFKAAIGTVLMDLYTKGGSRYIGREYAKQTGRDGRKREDIISPCPSMFGATTPSTFYGAMGSGAIESGFLPRLCVIRAPDRVPEANLDAELVPPPSFLCDWMEQLKLRLALHEKEVAAAGNLRGMHAHYPIRIPFSAEAKELRKAEMTKNNERRNSGVDELTSQMISRMVENAARIALIIALAADPWAIEVDVECLQLALDIVNYTTDMYAADVRANLFDSKYAELEAKVMHTVKKYYMDNQRPITERILYNRCSAYRSAKPSERKGAVEALKGRGEIFTGDGRNQGSWWISPTAAAME